MLSTQQFKREMNVIERLVFKHPQHSYHARNTEVHDSQIFLYLPAQSEFNN